MLKGFRDDIPPQDNEKKEKKFPFVHDEGNIPFTTFECNLPIGQKKMDPKLWQKIKEEVQVKTEVKGDNYEIKFLIMRNNQTGEYPKGFIVIIMEDGDKVEFEPSKSLCDLIARLPEEYFNSLN